MHFLSGRSEVRNSSKLHQEFSRGGFRNVSRLGSIDPGKRHAQPLERKRSRHEQGGADTLGWDDTRDAPGLPDLVCQELLRRPKFLKVGLASGSYSEK